MGTVIVLVPLLCIQWLKVRRMANIHAVEIVVIVEAATRIGGINAEILFM